MTPKINWKPNERELRQFGITLWVGFGLIGLIAYYKGHPQVAFTIWATAGAIGLLAIVLPRWSKPFYWFWMGFGFVMGSIMSRVVMGLIFFGVITPIATYFRLTRRDSLGLKRLPDAKSYWHDHPEVSKQNYSRLF